MGVKQRVRWEAVAGHLAWRCVARVARVACESEVCAVAFLVYLRVNIARDHTQIEAGPERKTLRERRESARLAQIYCYGSTPSFGIQSIGGIVWSGSGSSLERVRLLIMKSS